MSDKPQVVHCNDLDTLLPGVLAKKKFGCRLVYDAHEFYPVADSLCRWLDMKFFYLVERLLIHHADAVVTVNPMLAEAMREAYSLRRVYSVPNVETWIENRPAPSSNSRMAALAAGRIKFLFQGRFTLARGIEEIVRTWSLVDGSKAALFLRGPDNAWRKKTMDLAAQLGLLDRSVYFLDSVTEDDLVPAAAEADVGIIPYLPLAINERLSCPNKLSQYMHAGLMIICNDLPYVKSVVAAADAGLSYTSDDLSTLAAAAAQVVGDPELLRRCQANALRFARDDFNWQVHGKTFLKLYAGEEPTGPSRYQPHVGDQRPTACSAQPSAVVPRANNP
jgi:glycosyltransferase involved in cell wall biosynthesis